MNAATGLTDTLSELVDKEQHHGKGTKGYQKEPPIQINHHDDGGNQDNAFCYHFYHVLDHSRLQSVNVVSYIAHNSTSFIFIVKGQAQTL